jgi:histidine triad (HIT) family protein
VNRVEPRCPFCAAGGAPTTSLIYETAEVLALIPLQPVALGHMLVIPRRHIPDLWDLDPASAAPLTDAVLRLGHAIRRGLGPDGLNVITSTGAAAGQTVRHLHVHLVPRWEGDAFGDLWPRPSPPLSPHAVQEAAAAIRSALAQRFDDRSP